MPASLNIGDRLGVRERSAERSRRMLPVVRKARAPPAGTQRASWRLARQAGIAAGLYGWSKRLTERYRGLEHLERQVIELRDHCARELPRESPGPQWPTA